MARIYYPGLDPEPDPEKKRELRLEQLEALYRIVHEIRDPGRSKSALVGAGMGSGKTVVSCEVILHTNPKRCLIVGTRDSFSQWRDQMRDQGGTRPILRINKTATGRKNLDKLLAGDDGIYFAGLEMLRAQDWEKVSETHKYTAREKELYGITKDYTDPVEKVKQKNTYAKMPPVDLLISDEAHKHSNQKAAGLKTMETIPAVAKVALSGTFYGNRFENAWSIATWLWGKAVIGTKGHFEIMFCIKEPVMSKDGRTQIKTRSGYPLSKIIGERVPGEYVETLPCYVFIPTPIGPVPPPEIVKFDLGSEQLRQYDEMERQSLTWVPTSITSTRAPLIADLPLTQRGRLRTAALGGMTLVPGVDEDDPDSIRFDPGCQSSTLNEAYKVLHRPTWAGKKALILTHSKQFAIEAARRIGQKYPTALKTGDVSGNQWDSDKYRFMLPPGHPDSIQYLVAVISAVGTATDGLQVNCAKVLWLSEDDSNVNNIQGANRVWRDGVILEDYEAVKLVQRNTIAEGVLAKNDAHKASLLDSVAGQT